MDADVRGRIIGTPYSSLKSLMPGIWPESISQVRIPG
jgi:hypothetical protein